MQKLRSGDNAYDVSRIVHSTPKMTIRSAADVVQAACAESIAAMNRCHADALRARADAIHRMRVGTRRLRAILRVFSSIMDEAWALELESELRWLAHTLGATRDLDVLRHGLKSAAQEQPRDIQEMVASVDLVFAERHRDAKHAMKEGLKSERYDALLTRLHEAQLAPQLTLESEGPALDVLLPELRRAWKKLTKRADALQKNDDPLKFHAVRKTGKRIRYATELLVGDFSPDERNAPEKFIKKMKKLQDVLGAFQDATVAISTIELMQKRTISKTHSYERISYERIIDAQKELQKKARRKFQKAWNSARRSGNKKWM